MKKNAILYGLLLGAAVLANLLFSGGPNSSPHLWSGQEILYFFADLFLKTFNDRNVALILAGTIVAAALAISCIFVFYKVRPIYREITGVIYNVAGIAEAPGHGSMPDMLENAFSRAPRLSAGWARWSQGFRAVQGTNGPPRRYAVVPAHEIFSVTSLDDRGVPFGVYRKLPDLFVGVGLVLTFCGLVAGLYFAGKGLTATDLGEAKLGLLNLLNASTFKFLTSIAGVSGSLLIAFTVQWGLEALRRSLDRLTLAPRRAHAATLRPGQAVRGPGRRRDDRRAEAGRRMRQRPDDQLMEPVTIGYYVPLADLLTGLIFILMVLIAALTITQRADLQTAERLEVEHKRVAARIDEIREVESKVIEPRQRIAEALQQLTEQVSAILHSRGVAHEIDAQAGRISVPLGELFADRGDTAVSANGETVASAIADALRRALPCLAAANFGDPEVCQRISPARLERALITVRAAAATPTKEGGVGDPVALAGVQATSVYAAILRSQPLLAALYDGQSRPVLEFRGLGGKIATDQTGALPGLELSFGLQRPDLSPRQWSLPPPNAR
jgi:hypothetical protein